MVEGNRIYNCRLGNYGDTGSTKDSIIRNNHFRAVASGPLRNLGRTNPLKTGVSLTRGGADNKTATFTTQAAHGLEVGQAVRIQNAHIGGLAVPDDGQTYNGFLAVDSVPTSTSFTYRMITAPAADADTTPSANLPTFDTLWQVGLIVIENNLIELIPSINNWGAPVGVQFYQPSPTGSQYVFRKAIIRNNVIRFADGASDQLQFALGIRLWNCESAIVEDNIVDLDAPNPIRHYNCKSIRYFNNRISSGALLQGAEEDIALHVIRILPELTNDVEDALLLSM